MQKGALFLYVGVFMFGFLFPIHIFAAKNQVKVSATVLEHLTYSNYEGKIKLVTNTEYVPFMAEKDGLIFISLGY